MPDNFSQPKFVDTGRGSIAYFFNNEFPGQPTLVCLHGLSSNHSTFNLLAAKLRQHKINVLAVDQRGHGHSDKTKKFSWYKFGVFSEDLKKILDNENLSDVILLGYSYGGFVALDFINRYPSKVGRLILMSTSHVNPFKYWRINFLTWPAYWGLVAIAWLVFWQGRRQYLYFDHEKGENFIKSALKGLLTMPLCVNFWMLAEVANADFSESVKKISCPCLIIKAENDAFISDREAADMIKKMPSAEMLIIDEKTHFIGTRFQEKVGEAIVNFFKKQKVIEN